MNSDGLIQRNYAGLSDESLTAVISIVAPLSPNASPLGTPQQTKRAADREKDEGEGELPMMMTMMGDKQPLTVTNKNGGVFVVAEPKVVRRAVYKKILESEPIRRLANSRPAAACSQAASYICCKVSRSKKLNSKDQHNDDMLWEGVVDEGDRAYSSDLQHHHMSTPMFQRASHKKVPFFPFASSHISTSSFDILHQTQTNNNNNNNSTNTTCSAVSSHHSMLRNRSVTPLVGAVRDVNVNGGGGEPTATRKQQQQQQHIPPHSYYSPSGGIPQSPSYTISASASSLLSVRGGSPRRAAAAAAERFLDPSSPSSTASANSNSPTSWGEKHYRKLRWPVAANDLAKHKEAQKAAKMTISMGFLIGLIAVVSLHHMFYTRVREPNMYRQGSLMSILLTPLSERGEDHHHRHPHPPPHRGGAAHPNHNNGKRERPPLHVHHGHPREPRSFGSEHENDNNMNDEIDHSANRMIEDESERGKPHQERAAGMGSGAYNHKGHSPHQPEASVASIMYRKGRSNNETKNDDETSESSHVAATLSVTASSAAASALSHAGIILKERFHCRKTMFTRTPNTQHGHYDEDGDGGEFIGFAFCFDLPFLLIIIFATAMYAFVVAKCHSAPFLPIDGGCTDPQLIVDCAVMAGLPPHSGVPLPSLEPTHPQRAIQRMLAAKQQQKERDKEQKAAARGDGKKGTAASPPHSDQLYEDVVPIFPQETFRPLEMPSSFQRPRVALLVSTEEELAEPERYSDVCRQQQLEEERRSSHTVGGFGFQLALPIPTTTMEREREKSKDDEKGTGLSTATRAATNAPKCLSAPRCPAIADCSQPQAQPPLTAANFPPGTFCTDCALPKPLRAKHCHACGRCVLGMDHHCPWIGACVGAHNRLPFTILTCSMLVAFGKGIAAFVTMMNLLSFLEWSFLFAFCFVFLLVLIVTITQLIAVGKDANTHELMRDTLFTKLRATLRRHREHNADLMEASVGSSSDSSCSSEDDDDETDLNYFKLGGCGWPSSFLRKVVCIGLKTDRRGKFNKKNRNVKGPVAGCIRSCSSLWNGCAVVLGRYCNFLSEVRWLFPSSLSSRRLLRGLSFGQPRVWVPSSTHSSGPAESTARRGAITGKESEINYYFTKAVEGLAAFAAAAYTKKRHLFLGLGRAEDNVVVPLASPLAFLQANESEKYNPKELQSQTTIIAIPSPLFQSSRTPEESGWDLIDRTTFDFGKEELEECWSIFAENQRVRCVRT